MECSESLMGLAYFLMGGGLITTFTVRYIMRRRETERLAKARQAWEEVRRKYRDTRELIRRQTDEADS